MVVSAWQVYEEAAQQVLEDLGRWLGVSKVEGKQDVTTTWGDPFEIDAVAWTENGRGRLLVEVKRHTRAGPSKDIVAALAYKIDRTKSEGGIIVSVRPLQSGAAAIAQKENIRHVRLDKSATPNRYLAEYMDRMFMGLSIFESVEAADRQTASLVINVGVSERASASDQSAASVVLAAGISEAATALDQSGASTKSAQVVACLGWGSLVWSPDKLPTVGEWRSDGPWLPLEFARTSEHGQGRLTLVITPSAQASQSLWIRMASDDAEAARVALAAREGGKPDSIGLWPSEADAQRPCYEAIGTWAKEQGLSAVVWTALAPMFGGVRGAAPSSAADAVAYLRSRPTDVLARAEEYVRRAPRQIRTPFRDAFERELGWTSAT